MGNNYWGLTSTDVVSDQELLFCWVWVPPSTGHANLGIDKPCLKEVWTSATKHVLISKVGTEIICIYVHLSYHVYVPCYLFFVVILWSWWSYQFWYIIILSICEKYTVNILCIYIHQYIYIYDYDSDWYIINHYLSYYDQIMIQHVWQWFSYSSTIHPQIHSKKSDLRSGRHDGTHRLQSMEPWRVHRSVIRLLSFQIS